MTIKSGEDVNQCHQEEDNVFHEQNDTTNSEESKNEECLCKQEQVVDDNQKETDELQKIIEEKQKEIDEYKNRWLRVKLILIITGNECRGIFRRFTFMPENS